MDDGGGGRSSYKHSIDICYYMIPSIKYSRCCNTSIKTSKGSRELMIFDISFVYCSTEGGCVSDPEVVFAIGGPSTRGVRCSNT